MRFSFPHRLQLHGLKMVVIVASLMQGVRAYARYWSSCNPPRLGRRIMRREVLPPSSSSHDALFVQLGEAALPNDVDALRLAGRNWTQAIQAGKNGEDDQDDDLDDDDDDELDAEEYWHHGLGAALRKSTQTAVDEVGNNSLPSLIVWPHLDWRTSFQLVLFASSGAFQPLPAGHVLLSNQSGGLLDPAISSDGADSEAANGLDIESAAMYQNMWHVRCGGKKAIMVKSIRGRLLPPLLWQPHKEQSGVAFAMAYAAGSQVRLANLQIGPLSETPFQMPEEDEL
eukprot:TRINITY_DN4421_c1_g2_i1.p1 TRINITY_DN4421_c1_g2~~TRINITY_DN4421_c1_g2_i1.p1  ORF type:complete len:295 (+),score=41.25 TRINITY_DN4421_c1_g2_i1:36-887(+)